MTVRTDARGGSSPNKRSTLASSRALSSRRGPVGRAAARRLEVTSLRVMREQARRVPGRMGLDGREEATLPFGGLVERVEARRT